MTGVEFQLRVMIDIKGFGFDIYFLSLPHRRRWVTTGGAGRSMACCFQGLGSFGTGLGFCPAAPEIAPRRSAPTIIAAVVLDMLDSRLLIRSTYDVGVTRSSKPAPR